MGLILDIVSVLKALIGLWRAYEAAKEAERIRIELKRNRELEEALKASQEAKTPGEAWDAQDGIVKNSN